MKYFLFFFLTFVCVSNADEIDNKVNLITKNLRCLVCEGQSVYESNSDFAKDVKNYVRKEIIENKSNEEIYNFLKTKYGESIIFNPLISLKNIMLWLAPGLFFTIGIIIIFRRLSGSK